jgi:peptide/nickel transport system substrate-binding protein
MDQMVVSFRLLPALRWSDNRQVTAFDSVYSFELNADPDTPDSKYKIDRTASYEAVNSLTVAWTGLPGYLDSTYFLNFWTPAPKHIWSQYSANELLTAEESARLPMGFGPYIIKEWIPNKSIILEKNPFYFRANEGLPKFNSIVFRMVGENSNANIASIISGECDIIDQTSNLEDQVPRLLQLQEQGYLNATLVTGTVWEHADFGIKPHSYDDGYDPREDRPDIFGDVRTRRAIAMCMDRQAVVDNVIYGQSSTLDTYLPPTHPLFNDNVTSYPFDIEAGSELLEEVGWKMSEDGVRVAQGVESVPDGTLLSFNYYTTAASQRQKTTSILAESLAQCGVELQLEYIPADEYYNTGPDGPLLGRNYDMAQFAWGTSVEPPCALWMSDHITGPIDKTPAWGDFKFCGWGCENTVGFSNPLFDAACKAALSALPGQLEYEENHLKAQEIFAEYLPVVPLYLRLKLAATRPDMCNFIMDPTADSEMWNIENFGYGDMCQ